MATKRKKRRKSSGRSGGGAMSGLRGGFKRAVGQGHGGSRKKESLASRLFTIALLAAAIGMVIYRLKTCYFS